MLKEWLILILMGIICIGCVEGATIVVPSSIIANCYAGEGEHNITSIYLDNAKDGLSGYKMTIGFSTGGVAKIHSVTFPEWTNMTHSIVGTLPGQSVTMSAADLNQQIQTGSVNVSLCTLELEGITSGTTSLNVNVIEMTNDYGKPISITPSLYSSIIVYSVPPLKAHLNAPRDMDNNINYPGCLDDFNGNKVIDIDDIVVFFQAWSSGVTNTLPVPPFDYNKNGRIDVNDIVVFFKEYWTP